MMLSRLFSMGHVEVPAPSPEALRVRAALIEPLWEGYVLTRPDVQEALDRALAEIEAQRRQIKEQLA